MSAQPAKPSRHTLVEIMRAPAFGNVDRVVRWCRTCGAIVVDGESDGRTRPGHYQPMQRPDHSPPGACR